MPDLTASPPPKARLTLRVGVTGHRPNRLADMDEAQLRNCLRDVLTKVRNTVHAISEEDDTKAYYNPEPPLLRIVSPLAEGADQLVAAIGLELGFELHCPLPFAQDDYAHTFTTDISREAYRQLLSQATRVLELNGSRHSPQQENDAYETVGRLVLRQCDVLITIWDGDAVQQARGGTYQIIDEAARLQLPTVWIPAQAPHNPCLLGHDVRGLHCTAPLDELPTRLQTLLRPPASPSLELGQAYFNERWRRYNPLGGFYQWFLRWIAWSVPDQLPQRQAPDLPAAVTDQIETRFLKHYHWTDELANYYAGLYRGAFTLCYLLSGFAVLMAMLNDIFQCQLFIVMELFMISLIMVIVFTGRKNRWHDRWIDYRLLAEQFRQMRFLAPLGYVPPVFSRPAYDSDDLGFNWMNWQFRAILREAGLLQARIDEAYLESYRQRLIDYEILSQVDYHCYKASQRSEIIKERLHRWGKYLFILTFVVCMVHLFPHDNEWLNKWLTLGAAVLPAFGATSAGILGYGEFARVARRSEAIYKHLDELRKLQTIPSYNELGWLAEEAAKIMLSEVLDWRIVFRLKPLDLPA